MVAGVIFRPVHLPGIGVRTPAEYRALQARYLRLSGNLTPPWLYVGAPVHAHVGAGAWRVLCACGEAPPADPEWRLACCSGCGAIYEGVTFPEDITEIEAVLLKRRNHVHRNWHRDETVAALRAENVAHGEPE